MVKHGTLIKSGSGLSYLNANTVFEILITTEMCLIGINTGKTQIVIQNMPQKIVI